jgi:hypothetical protein
MLDETLLEYHVVRQVDRFVAIDLTDEVVGVYDTEQEARQGSWVR